MHACVRACVCVCVCVRACLCVRVCSAAIKPGRGETARQWMAQTDASMILCCAKMRTASIRCFRACCRGCMLCIPGLHVIAGYPTAGFRKDGDKMNGPVSKTRKA